MLYYRPIIPCRRLTQGKSWASHTRSSNHSALCTVPGPGAEGGWLVYSSWGPGVEGGWLAHLVNDSSSHGLCGILLKNISVIDLMHLEPLGAADNHRTWLTGFAL